MRKQIWQPESTSVSVCFHDGLVFNHTLCNPKTMPSSVYHNVEEGTLARTMEGNEKLGQIEPARLKGGRGQKKLTKQTMSPERESCIIFGSDDGLINQSNESGDAGIVGKQKQMMS